MQSGKDAELQLVDLHICTGEERQAKAATSLNDFDVLNVFIFKIRWGKLNINTTIKKIFKNVAGIDVIKDKYVTS